MSNRTTGRAIGFVSVLTVVVTAVVALRHIAGARPGRGGGGPGTSPGTPDDGGIAGICSAGQRDCPTH